MRGLRSLRLALRGLAHRPAFAAATVATLAVCLGANLALFAVVDGVLLRPLPYRDPERLVTVYHSYPRTGVDQNAASLTTYFERRGKLPAIAQLAAIDQTTTVLGEPGATSIESLGRVTPEFFATLGVEPVLGRSFREEELTYQTDHVAVISHELWRERFGGDPAVLGRVVRLDGIARVVVGVLPPGFRFLSFAAPVYMPLSSEESERAVGARHTNRIVQVARLAPGATVAQAQAQVDALDAAQASSFPQPEVVAESGYRAVVAPLHREHVEAVRPALALLQGAALLLLAIGAVNLVNLFLVRTAGRAHEIAVRRAIGAGRGHLVRDALAEALVVSVAGGLLGLGVAVSGIRLLTSLAGDRLPLGARVALDGRVALAGLFGALLAGLVLAAPAIAHGLRRDASALHVGRGGTASRSARRLRAGFVVAQVALAFVLLIGAGLLALSLDRAMAVSPGFRAENVVTGRFNLPWLGYHDLDSFQRFFDRLRERMSRLPEIVAVGAVSSVPLGEGGANGVITVAGRERPPGEAVVLHDVLGVAGDYFAAMDIPLVAGRFLDRSDEPQDRNHCVVDERVARRYWPGGDAVGQRVYRGSEIAPGDEPYTVVGVVGAVKYARLTEDDRPGAIYFPFSHVFLRNYYLAARTRVAPDAAGPLLARTLREIDPELPLSDVKSMEVRVADSLAERRSPALLAGLFAAAALFLSCIGLYGVLAYSVTLRTREFGIRMALGARPSAVLRRVLGDGARLVVPGLVIGFAAALALSGTLASHLFGVGARDPRTFALVAVAFGALSSVACVLPARRATRVDPMEVLRDE
jgi:predicted permease